MRPVVPEVEGDDRPPSSRATILGAAAAALAGLASVPLVARLLELRDADAAASKAQDAKILQLVLQLEYMKVGFYEQALKNASLKGDLRTFATTALGHEHQHLAAVKKALGPKAGPKPSFDFGQRTHSANSFVATAIELEDIAVAGYNGQATNLTKPTLAAAAEIVSVEARHAAWVRALAGDVAAPDPVDKPLTAQQVVQRLHAIGLKG
jgi:Ferritin-like domain